MNLRPAESFIGDYEQLPERLQKQTDKALAFLLRNFRHPSLQVKKMENRYDAQGREIWEARISQSHRFTFVIDGEDCILRRIGNHDILKKP